MTKDPFTPPNFPKLQFDLSDQIDQVSQISADFDARLESIAEAKREEYEREEKNSENLQLTAKVLNGMLATMRDEAEKAAERDKEARTAATKNFWIAFTSMAFAALAIVAPFVIEAIKGWK
jgi:septal ring factor EnvC (AmiA/AmiB activator)